MNTKNVTVGSVVIWIRGRHAGVVSQVTSKSANNVEFVNVTRRRRLKGPYRCSLHQIGRDASIVG